MRKSIVILIALFMVSVGQLAYAGDRKRIPLAESEWEDVTTLTEAQEAREVEKKVKAQLRRDIINQLLTDEEEGDFFIRMRQALQFGLSAEEAVRYLVTENGLTEDKARAVVAAATKETIQHFWNHLPKGSVGRFQAIRAGAGEKYVIILDTKEGHLWLWTSPTRPLKYQGRLCPYKD